jgi:hypothetical protein
LVFVAHDPLPFGFYKGLNGERGHERMESSEGITREMSEYIRGEFTKWNMKAKNNFITSKGRSMVNRRLSGFAKALEYILFLINSWEKRAFLKNGSSYGWLKEKV